jgi:multidrug efflux pump
VFARFFVERPIAAWVISIVITMIGLVAALTLPIAQYPDITPPTVQVTAIYPGANAKVVADSVAAPIEQQVNGVEGMMYMSSQCTNDGAYSLTITFELGTDLNMAQVLVQNRVALALPLLPQQVQIQGVNTKKRSPAILLVVNLISPDGAYDDLYLSNYATIKIKDELLRIKGVGDISFLGQRDYSMRVWLDPEKMAGLNLTAADVVTAVQAQNVQVAAGQIGQQPVPSGQQFQYSMSTLGRLEDENQFANIILKTGQGNKQQGSQSSQVVRIRDVGRIQLGAQQYDQTSQLDGQPTVGLAIFQLPGSNALDVAKVIKQKMEELKKSFPRGIDYRIVYDTTPFITQSVDEVFKTLIEAVILVAIVVLFFLQDWKAMILPMIDVPVSLIGTFAVMAAIGFTLNNLTLFGLVLAIGIVVDDAIVVLENIERLMATGLDAKTATIKAMDEVTGPIIAITLVLCSVFIPAAFITGVTGQFFRQFAITIATSMVISAINAMTLTPARAVTIFRSQDASHGHEHQREALPWWIFGIFGGLLSVKFGYALVAPALGIPINVEGDKLLNVPAWKPYAADALAFLPGLLAGMLVGWFIIKPVNYGLSRVFKVFNRLFDRLTAFYGATIARLLRVAAIVLFVYCGLLFLTYWSMAYAPTGFIPTQDQGYLLVNVQLPDSASVQRTQAIMDRIQRIALGDDTGKYKGPGAKPGEKHYEGIPGVGHAVSIAGQSFLLGANGSNYGSCFLVLDPFKDRTEHDRYDEVIAQKVQRLYMEEIDGAIVSVFRAPPIQGLGNAGGFKFQTEQKGFVDLPLLQKSTDQLIQLARGGKFKNDQGEEVEVKRDPRLGPMFTLFRAETPQLYVDIDRTKCEALQVDVSAVFDTLQVYMGGYFVNLFNKFGRTWQVNILAEPRFRTKPMYLEQLKVRNKLGKMVPLGTLAKVDDTGGPAIYIRYNMYASAPVNGSAAPGVSSGDAIEAVTQLAEKVGLPFEWTEITYLQIKAGNVAILIFALGTFLVYMVLAFKYESWRLPLSIILVVPMCLLCAVIGMLVTKLPVDIFVQIGFLVLVGLAAKNAILIVEFAEQMRIEGKPFRDAILEAGKLRFRPIVMTSFAFILGVVPLMIGEGAGAEMRRSLGTAVFSGMLGVTFFGVMLTPVFYYSIQWLFEGRKEKKILIPTETKRLDGEAKAPTV